MLASLLLSFVAQSVSFAADDADVDRITLSPTQKRYQLDAGESKRDELTVVNDGKNDYDFIVYARPYGVNGADYEPDFSTTKPNADAYKWVRFDKEKYHLEAGKSTKVVYTIEAPDGTAPGGHYGVLFVETQGKMGDGAAAIARNKRVDALLYTTVNGDFRAGGESVSMELLNMQSMPPLSAKISTKNTGNSDFENTISMKVSDAFGNLKYSVKQDFTILPETTRDMTIQWANSPWLGFYRVDISSSFLGKDYTKSSYVLMAPAWFYLTLFIILMAGATYAVVQWRKKH